MNSETARELQEKIKKKAFNIVLVLNKYEIKDFEGKSYNDLTESEIKELDKLLTRCNEILKKEG